MIALVARADTQAADEGERYGSNKYSWIEVNQQRSAGWRET